MGACVSPHICSKCHFYRIRNLGAFFRAAYFCKKECDTIQQAGNYCRNKYIQNIQKDTERVKLWLHWFSSHIFKHKMYIIAFLCFSNTRIFCDKKRHIFAMKNNIYDKIQQISRQAEAIYSQKQYIIAKTYDRFGVALISE